MVVWNKVLHKNNEIIMTSQIMIIMPPYMDLWQKKLIIHVIIIMTS